MNVNSVEKHCFHVLAVKLQVKVRFKTCYRLLELLYTTKRLAVFRIFVYPSSKCVIYRLERNIYNCVLLFTQYKEIKCDTFFSNSFVVNNS